MIELKGSMIEASESYIDGALPLYLITYSPDPKNLPNADFRLQHEFSVNLLADYLRTCYSGLFCVEATQLGNPHYHGWYQVDDTKELARLAIMKVMQYFGNVKIAKARSYKINCYTERKNALYYYKKDVFDAMLSIENNPISRYTESSIDWNSAVLSSFFTKEIKNPKRVDEIISDVKFYRQFYTDSLY